LPGSAQGRGLEIRTLKADENYKFKPSFGQDDYDIFSERIMDLVKIHDEDKILQTLVLCLRSDDAKKWFADLSQEDKEKLRVNTDNWISRFSNAILELNRIEHVNLPFVRLSLFHKFVVFLNIVIRRLFGRRWQKLRKDQSLPRNQVRDEDPEFIRR